MGNMPFGSDAGTTGDGKDTVDWSRAVMDKEEALLWRDEWLRYRLMESLAAKHFAEQFVRNPDWPDIKLLLARLPLSTRADLFASLSFCAASLAVLREQGFDLITDVEWSTPRAVDEVITFAIGRRAYKALAFALANKRCNLEEAWALRYWDGLTRGEDDALRRNLRDDEWSAVCMLLREWPCFAWYSSDWLWNAQHGERSALQFEVRSAARWTVMHPFAVEIHRVRSAPRAFEQKQDDGVVRAFVSHRYFDPHVLRTLARALGPSPLT